jgi:hypothetical protein
MEPDFGPIPEAGAEAILDSYVWQEGDVPGHSGWVTYCPWCRWLDVPDDYQAAAESAFWHSRSPQHELLG